MSGEELSPVTIAIENAIRSIPKGKAMTYGEIARQAGYPNGARQVSRVLHSRSVPGKLPWWRVLGKGKSQSLGRISLPGPGFEEQRALLRSEGVQVSDAGEVDLSVFGWHPQAVTPRR